jgi:hypothetical protein
VSAPVGPQPATTAPEVTVERFVRERGVEAAQVVEW